MKSRILLTDQKHIGPGPYSDRSSVNFIGGILEGLQLRDEFLLVVDRFSHCEEQEPWYEIDTTSTYREIISDHDRGQQTAYWNTRI